VSRSHCQTHRDIRALHKNTKLPHAPVDASVYSSRSRRRLLGDPLTLLSVARYSHICWSRAEQTGVLRQARLTVASAATTPFRVKYLGRSSSVNSEPLYVRSTAMMQPSVTTDRSDANSSGIHHEHTSKYVLPLAGPKLESSSRSETASLSSTASEQRLKLGLKHGDCRGSGDSNVFLTLAGVGQAARSASSLARILELEICFVRIGN
jgi:hypothetical protein